MVESLKAAADFGRRLVGRLGRGLGGRDSSRSWRTIYDGDLLVEVRVDLSCEALGAFPWAAGRSLGALPHWVGSDAAREVPTSLVASESKHKLVIS